ncbi:hypothetical protein ILUMI_12258 [Ignelater luminosus]|uniref:CHK kinase-like domain-containing protein n=1 Tax=Ignelater luminosus TaxID=2038154 RepID=A0A8K0CUK6_IGNLU|nr:hypothetical protein ILUMI_12258 [Ignelater luminosus]
MSNVNNLEGRIDNQIELLLKNIAEEEGFKDYKIEETIGSAKGDGYVGLMTAISIVGKTELGEEKVLHLIVKSAPKIDAVRDELCVTSMFEREIYMYDTVIPTFRKLEEEKGLEPFSSSPRCYKACTVEKSEALILENLRQGGYSLWEKKVPMEHDHVSLVMKEFGRFQAMSLAMRDQQPEKFKSLNENLFDILLMFIEKSDFITALRKLCINGLHSLDSLKDSKAYNIFQKIIDEDLSKFIQNLPQLVDNYSVILHGDGWTNNMMFKYEDKGNPGKPTKVCFFDFQTSGLGPAALDLSYFLYGCSSKTIIDNVDHYLDIYYESISTYLEKLGSNSQEIYPRSIFQEQWKKYSRYGLVNSMMLLHATLSEQNEVTDITELANSGKKVSDVFDYKLANAEIFNDRAKHIILHFVENGLI